MKNDEKPVGIDSAHWGPAGIYHAPSGDGFPDGGGRIISYFRDPDVDGSTRCKKCEQIMHVHGWVQNADGGHIICPGGDLPPA